MLFCAFSGHTVLHHHVRTRSFAVFVSRTTLLPPSFCVAVCRAAYSFLCAVAFPDSLRSLWNMLRDAPHAWISILPSPAAAAAPGCAVVAFHLRTWYGTRFSVSDFPFLTLHFAYRTHRGLAVFFYRTPGFSACKHRFIHSYSAYAFARTFGLSPLPSIIAFIAPRNVSGCSSG